MLILRLLLVFPYFFEHYLTISHSAFHSFQCLKPMDKTILAVNNVIRHLINKNTNLGNIDVKYIFSVFASKMEKNEHKRMSYSETKVGLFIESLSFFIGSLLRVAKYMRKQLFLSQHQMLWIIGFHFFSKAFSRYFWCFWEFSHRNIFIVGIK